MSFPISEFPGVQKQLLAYFERAVTCCVVFVPEHRDACLFTDDPDTAKQQLLTCLELVKDLNLERDEWESVRALDQAILLVKHPNYIITEFGLDKSDNMILAHAIMPGFDMNLLDFIWEGMQDVVKQRHSS